VGLPVTVAVMVKVTLPPAGMAGIVIPAPCIAATVTAGQLLRHCCAANSADSESGYSRVLEDCAVYYSSRCDNDSISYGAAGTDRRSSIAGFGKLQDINIHVNARQVKHCRRHCSGADGPCPTIIKSVGIAIETTTIISSISMRVKPSFFINSSPFL
jgi:hypothetical protein